MNATSLEISICSDGGGGGSDDACMHARLHLQPYEEKMEGCHSLYLVLTEYTCSHTKR